MRLGTNYPSGPLEWGERIGLGQHLQDDGGIQRVPGHGPHVIGTMPDATGMEGVRPRDVLLLEVAGPLLDGDVEPGVILGAGARQQALARGATRSVGLKAPPAATSARQPHSRPGSRTPAGGTS